MVNKSRTLDMSRQHRTQLEAWVRAKKTPQRVVFRSQICLFAAEGMSTTQIAQSLSTSRPTVSLWKKRFEEQGPPGLLQDAPRGPSPRRLDESVRDAIVDAVTDQAPPDGMKRWTTRTLAKALGVSNATVARVWRSRGIKRPHRKVEKHEKAKAPETNRFRVVGTYVTPPFKILATRPVEIQSPWERSPKDVASLSQCGPHATAYEPPEHGCRHCLGAALELIDRIASNSQHGEVDFLGLLQYLENIEQRTSDKSSMVLMLSDPLNKVTPLLNDWVARRPFISLRIVPRDAFVFTDQAQSPNADPSNLSLFMTPGAVSNLVHQLESYVPTSMVTQNPFRWIDGPSFVDHAPPCKAVSETVRRLGSFMASLLTINAEVLHLIYSNGGHSMNWKQKLESWFAAVAFAEVGEHATAAEIAARPIPGSDASPGIVSKITTSFAASAFAEENCHDMAAQILSGKASQKSFLDAVGLNGIRVRYGIAYLEQSFVDAVGLTGARYKILTLRL